MTPPVRVALALAPGPAGGLESVVQMLARGLPQTGVATAIVLALEAGQPVDAWAPLRDLGVELFSEELPHRAYLRERGAYLTAFRSWNPDVVHTHGYRADLLAGWAAARVGARRVSTLHGFTGGDWKNRMYERVQLRALRRFDAVVAVSRPIRGRLVAVGVPEARIHVVPNAWAERGNLLSRRDARAVLGLPEDARVLGWVGRLSPEKGADILLDAVARLGDASLIVSIVGDGREQAALRERGEALGLGDRVRWHGLHPDAGRLMTAFDGYVLSSRTEGTPIALFEAMAAGVPVVATGVGGVPDVVSPDEAVIVPLAEAAALEAGIRRLFADDAGSRDRARRARDRLHNIFAPGPWLARHVDLYRSLLPGPHGKGTAC